VPQNQQHSTMGASHLHGHLLVWHHQRVRGINRTNPLCLSFGLPDHNQQHPSQHKPFSLSSFFNLSSHPPKISTTQAYCSPPTFPHGQSRSFLSCATSDSICSITQSPPGIHSSPQAFATSNTNPMPIKSTASSRSSLASSPSSSLFSPGKKKNQQHKINSPSKWRGCF
jgi:hypothetical protein